MNVFSTESVNFHHYHYGLQISYRFCFILVFTDFIAFQLVYAGSWYMYTPRICRNFLYISKLTESQRHTFSTPYFVYIITVTIVGCLFLESRCLHLRVGVFNQLVLFKMLSRIFDSLCVNYLQFLIQRCI